MPDPVVQPPQGEGEPGTPINDPAQQTAVSREEFAALKKSLDNLHFKLRQAPPPVAPAPTPATPVANNDEPTTQKETVKKLIEEAKEREKKIDKKLELAARKTRQTGIRTAITAAGIVDQDAAEILEGYLEQKHGSQIKLDDDDHLTVTNELEESKDIGDFVVELLKSPKGKLFKPEKAPGPNARGSRGNSAAIPGQKSFNEMSLDERLKLEKTDRNAYLELARQAAKG